MTEIPKLQPDEFKGWEHTQIRDIKFAAFILQKRDPVWLSADGEYLYKATSPLDLDFDLTQAGNMPAWQFDRVLNAWLLKRVSAQVDEEGKHSSTLYTLAAGLDTMVTEWKTPSAIFDPRINDPIAPIEERQAFEEARQVQTLSGYQDQANIDNAIYDLNEIAREEQDALAQKRLSMTPEEKRLERQMNRRWLVAPEVNPTGEPTWWGVTVGQSAVYAVFCVSAEEAILRVEDDFYNGQELTFFFIDKYPEESQANLEKHKDQTALRLIPFSTTAWPKDFDNLTEEESATLDRVYGKKDSD